MRLYHGTCTLFVASIKREGLKPEPNHAWHLLETDVNTTIPVEKHGVYLTPSLRTARMFAKSRAQYESIPSGKSITFGQNPDFRKLAGSAHANVKPVVITVDVDVTVFTLHHDLDTQPSDRAYWTDQSIPPSQIVAIKTL